MVVARRARDDEAQRGVRGEEIRGDGRVDEDGEGLDIGGGLVQGADEVELVCGPQFCPEIFLLQALRFHETNLHPGNFAQGFGCVEINRLTLHFPL